MAQFKAAEFSGLPYAVGPDAAYQDIFAEALSEARRIAGSCQAVRYARLNLSIANAGRRIGAFVVAEAALEEAARTFNEPGQSYRIVVRNDASENEIRGLVAEAVLDVSAP